MSLVETDQQTNRHTYPKMLCCRSITSQSTESLQSLPLKINSELFLETLFMEIRRVTILFSASKKQNHLLEKELSLLSDNEILENQVQNNVDHNDNLSTELNDKKEALEDLYKYQAQGAYRGREPYISWRG